MPRYGILCMSEDNYQITVGMFVLAAQRITSSAWNRRVGEIVRPSSFAVFRLMTSSNFVGCSTGRSPGLAPFRIREFQPSSDLPSVVFFLHTLTSKKIADVWGWSPISRCHDHY
jgi:hypothetical protein